jgi:hypothetical protein
MVTPVLMPTAWLMDSGDDASFVEIGSEQPAPEPGFVAVPLYASPAVELYGWVVSGCSSIYRGEHAEIEAQAEAARCGGNAKSFPLYRKITA